MSYGSLTVFLCLLLFFTSKQIVVASGLLASGCLKKLKDKSFSRGRKSAEPADG